MEQRIVIALVIVALGVLAYAAFKLWHRRSVSGSGLPAEWEPGVPGILYFGSENCAPCGPQGRAVERVGSSGRLNIVKVDADKEPEVAKTWNVLSLPTTFVLDAAGEVREVNHGVASEKKLRKQIERVTSGAADNQSDRDKRSEGALI